MKLITLKIPERDIAVIDSIVKKSKKYDNRSDFIRVSINDLIMRET